MAKRYSGDLTITVAWDDRHSNYRTTVARKGRNVWSGRVGPPRSYEYKVDSEKAYDEAAHAAISFADNERSGIGEHAEMDPNGQWKIRRVKGYWEKWPGGRVKPKKLRDASRRRTRVKSRRSTR